MYLTYVPDHLGAFGDTFSLYDIYYLHLVKFLFLYIYCFKISLYGLSLITA